MTRKQTALYVARLGVTLFLITALVAAALAAVNHITAPRIAAEKERKTQEAIEKVLPGGGKLVAYVNSREQSIQLTRMLRHRLPQMAPRIGFYNAGLPKQDRKRIEEAFRTGALQAIVSTSAFG